MKHACVMEMLRMTIYTKVILAFHHSTFQSDLFQNMMKAVTSLRMEIMEISLKVLKVTAQTVVQMSMIF